METGFRHILDGTEHLLFLLCLVIPFRRLRPLVATVTAFSVAHSMSLVASAFGSCRTPCDPRRWVLAFAFGTVHRFGFSFAPRELLQFAGDHLWASRAGMAALVRAGIVALAHRLLGRRIGGRSPLGAAALPEGPGTDRG